MFDKDLLNNIKDVVDKGVREEDKIRFYYCKDEVFEIDVERYEELFGYDNKDLFYIILAVETGIMYKVVHSSSVPVRVTSLIKVYVDISILKMFFDSLLEISNFDFERFERWLEFYANESNKIQLEYYKNYSGGCFIINLNKINLNMKLKIFVSIILLSDLEIEKSEFYELNFNIED